MSKVSIIIPGRCEQYFQQTIDSLLEAAAGQIEIIAVADGYVPDPPLIARDDRVCIITLAESIGQRAAYNLGVAKSTGEYVMKLDAHAKVSPGFDVELQSHCPDNAVVLPEMRRLDVRKWKEKRRGKTHFMYFGLDLYTHFWRPYRRRPAAQEPYPEVMSGQGSCWFASRKWNDHIGLLDEAVGSWGNVGIEVSLRTWLCGGSQILNKQAWQAHWFRRDDGGFTYPMSGRQVAKAHKYTRENYYFNDHAFEHQVRPFTWLIEKFAPVPGWEVYLADQYKTPRTIVYYTDHHIDENLARVVRKSLQKAAVNIPIISVTQTPLDFGKNICVGTKPRSNRSIYEQILAGLEAAQPGSVIYLCEHDVVYHSSHFAHVPHDDRIEYNQNRYYWAVGQSTYLPARGKWPLSQIAAKREFLIQQVKDRLANEEEPHSYIRCPSHRFKSDKPNIDIRHGKNFSQDGRWKREYAKGKSLNTVGNIGHWGSVGHFLKRLGYRETPNGNLSPLGKLLRERYNLKTFRPGPVRVSGFHREDVAKIINMLGLRKGAEIGVLYGNFSAVLCEHIDGVELLSVDPWKGWSRKYKQNAIRKLSQYPATIIEKTSMEAVLEVPDNSLDFVYIDGNHNFDYVMEDLIGWSRKVRTGGIIAGHDYDRPHKKGVVPAVDMFVKMHNVQEWYLTDQKREASFFWMKA